MNDLEEFLDDFLVECIELVGAMEQALLALEAGEPGDSTRVAFRAIHTVKGNAASMGFSRLETLAHNAENILGQIRSGDQTPSTRVVSVLLEVVDGFREHLDAIETARAEGVVDDTNLLAKLAALEMEVNASGSESSAADASDDADPPAEAERSRANEARVRVHVDLLDNLMTLAGELVLTRNQILQSGVVVEGGALEPVIQRLDRVSTDLQEEVMRTRLVPIASAWERLPRLARDLAVSSGKQVQLLMEGGDTELDKSLVEVLRDPLAHVVRNSIDHGLEPSIVRHEVGKPEEGTVLLRARHVGGQVQIEVRDDGGGIDLSRVRERARSAGLVSGEKLTGMSDPELLDLIFRPGFSTAREITSTSGRGVGMDVVRTQLDRVGGQVSVESTQGVGTVVRMRVPLTVAIVPALIVRCGGLGYAVPQTAVVELLRVEADQRHGVIEEIRGKQILRLRRQLIPLVDLATLLGIPADEAPPPEEPTFIVVVEVEGLRYGLVTHSIVDTHEIVVKPLAPALRQIGVYAGATIMGDGSVAIILDPVGVARRSGAILRAARELIGAREAAQPEAVPEALVLLEARGGERLAVSLAPVVRFETFAPGRLERVAAGNVVQYGSEIMPVVRVERVLEERRHEPRPPHDGASGRREGEDPEHRVVVCHVDGESYGLEVERIIDIVEVEGELRGRSTRRFVTGTMVIDGRVTEVLDVVAIGRERALGSGPKGGSAGASA